MESFKQNFNKNNWITINLVIVGLGPPINEGSFCSSALGASSKFGGCWLEVVCNSGKLINWIPHWEAAIEVFGCAYSKYLFIQRSGIDIKGDVLKANYMLKLALEYVKRRKNRGNFCGKLYMCPYMPILAYVFCFYILNQKWKHFIDKLIQR